jgi:hypothetical protein
LHEGDIKHYTHNGLFIYPEQLRDASAIGLDLQKDKTNLTRENFELKELLDSANSCLETLRNVQVIILIFFVQLGLNEAMAELQLTGQNLGRVFNCRGGHVYVMRSRSY